MSRPPEIWTASWFTQLPLNFVRVGISRGVPRGMSGYRRYRQLEPGRWFRSCSAAEYVQRYRDEILADLDPHRVVRKLATLSEGRPIALLCWEQAGIEWCHRGIVAYWLGRHTDAEIREYGFPDCGLDHPLLPPSFASLIDK